MDRLRTDNYSEIIALAPAVQFVQQDLLPHAHSFVLDGLDGGAGNDLLIKGYDDVTNSFKLLSELPAGQVAGLIGDTFGSLAVQMFGGTGFFKQVVGRTLEANDNFPIHNNKLREMYF